MMGRSQGARTSAYHPTRFSRQAGLTGRLRRNVVVTRDVDELGRATATTVEQLAFGPGQVTYEAFQYDGLSRMLRGENNHAIVELRYDSLGPVIRETQTVNVGADRTNSGASWSSTVTAAVNAVYDANGNRTQLAYPGGATINETYDVIDRRKLVQDDATTIAEYMYAGRGYRVLEKRLPLAGTTLFRAYDGERRVTRHDQRRTSDDQRLAGYTYAWDRVGNRWYERTLTNNTNTTETGGAGEAFRYDSAYRMRDNFDGVTSGSLDGLSSNTPRHTGSLTYDTVRGYALDGVGNRSEVTASGIVESAYLLAGDDFKTNQYSFVDDAPQRYDLAGNLLTDGTWSFQYDFRNQLIRATDGTTDARYRHDVLGRRVSKRTASGNFPGLAYGHAVYIQSGTAILQERDTSSNIRKEWVYGIRIDEPIRQRAPDYADLDNDTNTTELVDLYYLTNSLGSVTALATTSGAVGERYVMDVWGVIRNVIDKSGSPTGAAWTLVGNPWVFTGRQFEFEERNGVSWFRSRAYQARIARFQQRDTVGTWRDVVSLGSATAYAGSNPANYRDPFGTTTVHSPRQEAGATKLTPDERVCWTWAWRMVKSTNVYLAVTEAMRPEEAVVYYWKSTDENRPLRGEVSARFVPEPDFEAGKVRGRIDVAVPACPPDCDQVRAAMLAVAVIEELVHMLAEFGNRGWTQFSGQEPYRRGGDDGKPVIPAHDPFMELLDETMSEMIKKDRDLGTPSLPDGE